MTTKESPQALPERPLAAFDAALTAGAVTIERSANYGHPATNFARMAELCAPLAVCTDPAFRMALTMIQAKVSRLIGNPNHLDSIIDIAGYARTMAMVLQKRADDAKAKRHTTAYEAHGFVNITQAVLAPYKLNPLQCNHTYTNNICTQCDQPRPHLGQ